MPPPKQSKKQTPLISRVFSSPKKSLGVVLSGENRANDLPLTYDDSGKPLTAGPVQLPGEGVDFKMPQMMGTTTYGFEVYSEPKRFDF